MGISRVSRLIMLAVLVTGFRWYMPVRANSVPQTIVDVNKQIKVSSQQRYQFEVKSNGYLKFSGEVNSGMELYQYDGNMNLVLMGSLDYGYRIPAGKYVIITGVISKDTNLYIDYKDESGELVEKEYNNTIDKATKIETNQWYRGDTSSIKGQSSDVDYYMFNVAEQSSIYAEMNNNGGKYSLEVFDGSGNTVANGQKLNIQETAGTNKVRVPAGTYYLKVSPLDVRVNSEYSLRVVKTQESDGRYEQEVNDTPDKANIISINNIYTGNIHTATDIDYFKFEVDKNYIINLEVACSSTVDNRLYNVKMYKEGNENEVLFNGYTNENGKLDNSVLSIDKGSYIFVIQKGDYYNPSVDYSIGIADKEEKKIESIVINAVNSSYIVGDTGELGYAISPSDATNKGVVWVSSNESIVTVDSEGRITCVSEGEAIVTVSAADNPEVYNNIMVSVGGIPVEYIESETDDKCSIRVGQTCQLEASAYPLNASDRIIIWTSSNKKIATVSDKGKVKGLKKGTVEITASDITGQASITFTVNVTRALDKVTALKDIKANGLKFSKSKTYYTIKAKPEQRNILVKIIKGNKYQKIYVNNKRVYKPTVNIKAGSKVKIKVVAENGNSKTYIITVKNNKRK